MSCTTGAIAVLLAFFGLAAVCQSSNQSTETTYRPDGVENTSKQIVREKDVCGQHRPNGVYKWIADDNTTWEVFSPASSTVVNAREQYTTITDLCSHIELKMNGYVNITFYNGGQFIGGNLDYCGAMAKCGIYYRADEEYKFYSYVNDATVFMESFRRSVGRVMLVVSDQMKHMSGMTQLVDGIGYLDVKLNEFYLASTKKDWVYYDRLLGSIRLLNAAHDIIIVVYMPNKTISGRGQRKDDDDNIWISEDNQTTVEFGLNDDVVKITGRWNMELLHGNELRSPLGVTKWTPSRGSYKIETWFDNLNISAISDWPSASVTISDFTYTLNSRNQIWSLADWTVIQREE